MSPRTLLALVVATVALALCVDGGARAQTARLTTTAHAPLPGHPSLYWLVPDASAASTAGQRARDSAAARFARGATLIADGNFETGLALIRGADLSSTPLANYGRYYAAVALLGLRRVAEAEVSLNAITDSVGYLEEAVPLRRAEAALASGDAAEAVDILDDLSDETLTSPEEVLVRLADAYEANDDPARALRYHQRVYYEFPLSTQANAAQEGIERLQTPALIPPNRFRLELERAERLFTARRWAQARAGFAPLLAAALGDDRELVALRLAECDFYLGRHRAAKDALRPYLKHASREAEARFFDLSATRALGDSDTYVALVRGLVADHSDSSWTEDALNSLASHYVTLDRDGEADEVFRELARRFPRGRFADRAAWKIGWEAYKQDRFAEAAVTFEAAAAAFPRADYRPSWLYWAAQSRVRLGQESAANALFGILAGDYLHSYYGRLAAVALAKRQQPAVTSVVSMDAAGGAAAALVRSDGIIRALVGIELYDAALKEVEYAQHAWGDSPALQATVAWIRHTRGLQEHAADRFADVRGAITIMRRAYPQFMAAGGEDLPPDVLRVIFPLDYWPLIRKYSEAHRLDPYLMAALIAQESTFTPDVRSSANAVGLMQLVPGTARRYARKLGIRYSSSVLTQPETNIRLGMQYFSELTERFGGAHFALASYNAGERRVAEWITERPGFEQDEFIDDIPFPETQNYVKRIIGTADDYRRLYGGGVLSTTSATR